MSHRGRIHDVYSASLLALTELGGLHLALVHLRRLSCGGSFPGQSADFRVLQALCNTASSLAGCCLRGSTATCGWIGNCCLEIRVVSISMTAHTPLLRIKSVDRLVVSTSHKSLSSNGATIRHRHHPLPTPQQLSTSQTSTLKKRKKNTNYLPNSSHEQTPYGLWCDRNSGRLRHQDRPRASSTVKAVPHPGHHPGSLEALRQGPLRPGRRRRQGMGHLSLSLSRRHAHC